MNEFIRLTVNHTDEIARVRISDISLYRAVRKDAETFVSMSNCIQLLVKETPGEIDALIEISGKGFKQYRIDVLREVAGCECSGCNCDLPVEPNASDAIMDDSCKWVHRHKDGTCSECYAEMVQDLIQAELKE